MWKRDIESKSVNNVAQQVNGSQRVLEQNNISAGGHRLSNAASAAGVPMDQLLAVMEHRMRRNAAKAVPARTTETEMELA